MMHLPQHWPYIAAAYALTLGSALILSITTVMRLRRAKKRLSLIESQTRHRERTQA
ncbi:heme exporter protein CcmD [Swingsia samuiensis]|uniref:Heme exporter protein CcmD n=2 Tax=Swingsia samuiensis TaxID=1293412 RepID=A0A4Y6UNQ4_9PROT|nr:heme exporter protein CcmD [Swingsia samuiensis]QDH18026.1 heme exporter protein CcmD [Swingsia samuiensis]